MNKNILGFNYDQKWDYENGFYLTSDSKRIPKMLAHYELYKSITDLPGHVIECGVYKAASFIRFATFRNVLESPFSRKIIGFDAFGKFPLEGEDADRKFIEGFEAAGGEGIATEELYDVLNNKGLANSISKCKRAAKVS